MKPDQDGSDSYWFKRYGDTAFRSANARGWLQQICVGIQCFWTFTLFASIRLVKLPGAF